MPKPYLEILIIIYIQTYRDQLAYSRADFRQVSLLFIFV